MSQSPPPSSKILIVDDEKAACDALRRFFERKRYEIDLAHDGKEALSKLDQFKPHCILLDIRMPELHGLDALKAIKLRQPEVEVIMLTGVADTMIAQDCQKNGAFSYIVKPVDLDDLMENIERALHRREETLEKRRDAENIDHLLGEGDELIPIIHVRNDELFGALRLPLDVAEIILPDFGSHGKDVAWLCREIGERIKPPQLRLCVLAGLYHDIGKLYLPRHLRETPAESWTPAEKEIYRQFPVYGQDLVQSHFYLGALGPIIRHQCERMDGAGFPDGLTGNQIPLESRIVAVANAFDEEMAKSNRLPAAQSVAQGETALEALKREAGKIFDPLVVEALAAAIDKHKHKTPRETATAIKDLKPGMVLSRNAVTARGELVLSRKTALNPERIKKILDFHQASPVSEPVYVYADPV